jgi:hypothetical protein
MCFFTAVFGMVVLWPTYVTAPKDQADVHGITLYTMAHLEAGSARLWVPTLVTWVYVSVCLRLMKAAYQDFVDRRLEFLLHDELDVKPQKRFSVMVQNIPRHLITTNAQLQEMFEELFPQQVHSANLLQPLHELEVAVQEREKILAALELATASYQASGMQVRPTVRLINAPSDEVSNGDGGTSLLPSSPKVVVGGMCSSVCCVVGEQKDALDYYNIQLTGINMTIRRLRDESGLELKSSDAAQTPSSMMLNVEYVPPLPPPTSSATSDKSSGSNLSALVGSNGHERLSNSSAVSEDGVALQTPAAKGTSESFLQSIQDITASAVAPIKTIGGWADMAIKGSALYDGHDIPTTTGFVTFSRRTAWLTAHRLGILSDVYPDLRILPAPDPRDLIWNNLMYSTKHTHQGEMVSSTIFRVGLVFWGSLISVVTAMSNLETLEEYMAFIEDLDNVSYALLAGLLPVALMAGLLASVPLIISAVVMRLDRLPSTSAVHRKVFQWTLAFLLANMFVSIISGSIFRSLEDFVDNPKLVLSYLADSFPSTSVLFCNYVISVTLVAGPNELLQIIPFLQFVYYARFNREATLTKRQLFAEGGPLCKKYYPFGGYLPQYVFVLTVVLFFSVISPLVPLVAFFFFGSRFLILRYQFLYVYTPRFNLGGKFWFDLVYHTMFGLVLFTSVMLFYTLLKQGFIQGMCLLPLPFLVWYQWKRLDHTFGRLSQDIAYAKAMQDHAPIHKAPKNLSSSNNNELEAESLGFTNNYYMHPALLAPIDITPLPYRISQKPLLAASEIHANAGGLCPCCSLVSCEVTPLYLAPLQESGTEGVTPLVDINFLDSSMLDHDIETDESKSERLKYSIDYSY